MITIHCTREEFEGAIQKATAIDTLDAVRSSEAIVPKGMLAAAHWRQRLARLDD